MVLLPTARRTMLGLATAATLAAACSGGGPPAAAPTAHAAASAAGPAGSPGAGTSGTSCPAGPGGSAGAGTSGTSCPDGSAGAGTSCPGVPGATGPGADRGCARPGAGPTAAGPRPRPQLPLGGRTLLPHYRVVAYYGGPGMNVLGSAPPAAIVPRLRAAARPFTRPGRPVQPAMELITTVAQARPGRDGTYSKPLPAATVAAYYDIAHRNHLLLLLDLQPGRGDFLAQAERYEPFLREPDVGLALDPEWKMGPHEVPAKVVGHDDAADVNRVSAWLARVVAKYDLPQKLFVVHQFKDSMIVDKPALAARSGLATVLHVDGFGSRPEKLGKYASLHVHAPLFNGFKLFYSADRGLLTPTQTLALRPAPDLVTYQ